MCLGVIGGDDRDGDYHMLLLFISRFILSYFAFSMSVVVGFVDRG